MRGGHGTTGVHWPLERPRGRLRETILVRILKGCRLVSTGSERPPQSGANRKLIRPRLDEQEHWPGTKASTRKRRPLPPQAETGAESEHFHKQVQLKTTLVVTLEDGTVLRGVLSWYDRDAIALRGEDGNDLVILKQAILHTVREGGGKGKRTP